MFNKCNIHGAINFFCDWKIIFVAFLIGRITQENTPIGSRTKVSFVLATDIDKSRTTKQLDRDR